jgi:hypothetical protein
MTDPELKNGEKWALPIKKRAFPAQRRALKK